MFTVSLRNALNAKPAFDKLVQLPLSLKMNRRISLILEQLNKEYERFEKLRKELITEIGVKNETDGTYSVPSEAQEHFFQEIDALIGDTVILNCPKLQESEIPETFALTPIEYGDGSFECFLEKGADGH